MPLNEKQRFFIFFLRYISDICFGHLQAICLHVHGLAFIVCTGI
jgi:hypothetical protein